jgi:Domain of unknown function (DUF1883)
MRFAYVNLGEQAAGTQVIARLHGSSANVLLLDEENFARYRANLPFVYTGGMRWRTPVELTVPEDGNWFVVLDHGGFRGRVHGHVEVMDGDDVVRHDTVRVP